MKILEAKTAYGGIQVTYVSLERQYKKLYPLETTEEEIQLDLKKLEERRIYRAEFQEKHKERLEKEAKAQETIRKLNE